jgi:hypothetical protein
MVQTYVANGEAVERDIKRISAAYRGHSIGMAYGGEGRDFRLTYFRPLLAFSGNPLLLDAIALMEADFAGRSFPQQTSDAVLSGQIEIWLVPKEKAPFQKSNWYAANQQIFPDGFRQLFRENFQRRDQSEFFDLWIHKGVSSEVGHLLQTSSALPRSGPTG